MIKLLSKILIIIKNDIRITYNIYYKKGLYNMFEDGINDVDKNTKQFYNIYCYKKQLEHIDKHFKGKYDYENVIIKTKNKNKASNKRLGKSEYSSGIPYDVVVFDLDYSETYDTNWCNLGNCGEKSNYEISLNKWKGQETLQLKIKVKDDINKKIKDVLRDCYDNKIIIDFGFDYILVIEDIPMYSYFSIIDESKYNNNYPIKYYYYDDDYVKNYISKRKVRDEFEDLLSIIDDMKKDEVIKKEITYGDVNMKKAPALYKYKQAKKIQLEKNRKYYDSIKD